MGVRGKQVIASLLALTAADVGGWATVAPHSFYTTFPFPGRHWVSALGPYNEHLTRDVGGLYLALLVVSVWSVLRADPQLLRMTGAAWLAFSVPHLLFHLDHLEPYGRFDQVANVVALGGSVVLAVVLLLPTRGGGRPATPHR
jgi:hypothetical protein